MKSKYNILIIPAGSGMAIAAIKAMRADKNLKIISADVNKLAPGLYLSDKGYLIQPFDSDSFYPQLESIIKKERIDVVIPALDPILLDFSRKKEYFEGLGTKVMVSDNETIEIGRDKWKTYQRLNDVISIPKSFIKIDDVDVGYPLFIKPRGGSGSEDTFKIRSQEELNFFFNRIHKPIIQEYLCGKEYTIDCLADGESNLLLSIVRERIETKAGISVKGEIIKNEKLDEMAKDIAKNLKFTGPFFFQAKDDTNGEPKLMEINPRISGTMSLSSHSGANIHTLAVRLLMGEKVNIPKINHGIYLTRYWEEIYLDNEMIENKVEDIK